VPIFNLMEDAATAEISRSQVWQWIQREKGVLDDGRKITVELTRQLIGGKDPHRGGELQVVPTPSGGRLFTAPAVLHTGGKTWMFVADGAGTAAWTLTNGRLVDAWKNGNAGTSPVVAGGLLYVYDPAGQLRVYDPETGRQVASLACGAGHWNSPIVADGRIVLPEGLAGRRGPMTPGVIDVWRLPKR